MILSDLRNYLRQRRRVSLADIALHFDTEPDALRGMLDHWIRKGKVVRQSASNSCGSSCCKCDPDAIEIYQWQDESIGLIDNSTELLPISCKPERQA